LKNRIGINASDYIVENFRSERCLDYTIIGSPINLASRLVNLISTR